MKLIDGKAIALNIQNEIKQSISKISGRPPSLAVILVGEHPASQIYIKRKTKACRDAGIRSVFCHLENEASEADLLNQIEEFNSDNEIDGILVQLPLPSHINSQRVTMHIDPKKDVDGFHPVNIGKLLNGETSGFTPCTPLGIKYMLEKSDIDVEGKHVVILGRSNIVGKPMAALLMQNAKGANATVTLLHSKSKNIGEFCRMADIIIVALGQPKYLKADMVKEGTVVIDVGINKILDLNSSTGYQIVGDVDFDRVKDKCSYISPVPGGVGPLTIAMLLQNTLYSYQMRHG